ncbi:hypothetical protein [Ruminococcus sp.]|uniref:hypothetical protein n=1 Tax=Ruminococcus sp. TaxID=41978 RepID=UPI00388F0E3B
MEGFIKLYRKIRSWGWYSSPSVKVVFLHFLISANYETSEYRGVTIERGQAVFYLNSLSLELGLSVKQIRTAIDKLKKTGEITVWTNHQLSVATICNFDKYQGMTENGERANEGQTKGKQRALKGQYQKK